MQASNFCVLYATEDEGASKLLTVLLGRNGYRVVTAESLVTALLVSLGQPYHLYVIDAQLWGGQGSELCRIIRAFDPLSPIILYSSDAAESARQGALEAGATSYVLKPDIGKLIEAVGHVTYDLLPSGGEII